MMRQRNTNRQWQGYSGRRGGNSLVSNRGASWPRCPLPRFRFWLRGGVLDHQSADRPIAFRESDIEHAIVSLQQGFALGTIGVKEPHTILAGVRLQPECLRARAGDPVTVKEIPTHLRRRSGQRDSLALRDPAKTRRVAIGRIRRDGRETRFHMFGAIPKVERGREVSELFPEFQAFVQQLPIMLRPVHLLFPRGGLLLGKSLHHLDDFAPHPNPPRSLATL